MKKLLSAIILAMLIAPISMEAKKKVKKVEVPQLQNYPSAELGEYRLHGGNVVVQGRIQIPAEANGEKVPQEGSTRLMAASPLSCATTSWAKRK